MTLNDLYQAAVRDVVTSYGVARHVLSSGDTLFCCVDRVAGRSVTRGHLRTTYRLMKVGEENSKQISRAAAAALLAL